MKSRNILFILIGIVLFIVFILFIQPSKEHPEIGYTLAAGVLMAFWWVSEAIPLSITALLPVILFPLLGVVDGKTISGMYFNHLIFLFMGGFVMALAMERWNLHRRIALKILLLVGLSPGRILLGFMLATAVLSMWMSNTATCMMMLPIVLSIIKKIEENKSQHDPGRFAIGLLLGIAYASSIGGIATLVGTPPNPMFVKTASILFPQMPEISFAQWFFFALPLSALLFVFAWMLLFYMYKPAQHWGKISSHEYKEELNALGPMKSEEKWVFILFIFLALAWILRGEFTAGSFYFPGWSIVFGKPEYINDGTVAVLFAVLLFLIPSKNRKGHFLMDWECAVKLPWHIVLLFGGGFALARAFVDSGLSIWIGDQLSSLAGVQSIYLSGMITLMMSFLTELTSNTATTQMVLPVLGGLSQSILLNPLLLMVPATLAASLAFMLPVATPPNAIVFGSGHLRIIDMVKTGFLLNMIGVILATLFVYFWGTTIFKIDPAAFPSWAETAQSIIP